MSPGPVFCLVELRRRRQRSTALSGRPHRSASTRRGRARLGRRRCQLLALEGEISADIIASLADDVETLGAPHVVVIDDFHLAGLGGVQVLMGLLEYRPPTCRWS